MRREGAGLSLAACEDRKLWPEAGSAISAAFHKVRNPNNAPQDKMSSRRVSFFFATPPIGEPCLEDMLCAVGNLDALAVLDILPGLLPAPFVVYVTRHAWHRESNASALQQQIYQRILVQARSCSCTFMLQFRWYVSL